MSGPLANDSGGFRLFNVVDVVNRECVLQIVDFSIGGERLPRHLDQFQGLVLSPGILLWTAGRS